MIESVRIIHILILFLCFVRFGGNVIEKNRKKRDMIEILNFLVCFSGEIKMKEFNSCDSPEKHFPLKLQGKRR